LNNITIQKSKGLKIQKLNISASRSKIKAGGKNIKVNRSNVSAVHDKPSLLSNKEESLLKIKIIALRKELSNLENKKTNLKSELLDYSRSDERKYGNLSQSRDIKGEEMSLKLNHLSKKIIERNKELKNLEEKYQFELKSRSVSPLNISIKGLKKSKH